jgi:hypothetical protein
MFKSRAQVSAPLAGEADRRRNSAALNLVEIEAGVRSGTPTNSREEPDGRQTNPSGHNRRRPI